MAFSLTHFVKPYQGYSPLVLRAAIALVFLYFGTSQILEPIAWFGFVPDYAQVFIPLPLETLIFLNGAGEVVLAVMLLVGWHTRWVALLLSLHLLHIVTIIGFNPTGIRDLGLAIATFSIFLNGPDVFCWEIRKKRKPRFPGSSVA